ncbi:MAG TPA: DUF4286 family protein [Chryseosolibacter sp.]|nr:DUF4286 family protein [Chryseosolibacter sp.]
MLLYNITVGIDKDIEALWLQWIKEKHIPAMMKTGLFVESRMFRVLHDDGDGTVSYSIQYFADSIEKFNQYLEKFAPVLIEEHRRMFVNKHVVFQTLLEEV